MPLRSGQAAYQIPLAVLVPFPSPLAFESNARTAGSLGLCDTQKFDDSVLAWLTCFRKESSSRGALVVARVECAHGKR